MAAAPCQFCGGPLALGAVACFRCGRMVPRAEDERTGASAVAAPTQLGTVAKAELLENQWRLVSQLGQGQAGQVWLGHDVALDRPVAVKVMHAARAQDPAQVERFERHARHLAGVEHPNLLPVLGVGKLGAQPFVVTPLLTGRTLAEHTHARGGRLDAAEAARIFVAVCEALEALHAAGLAHGDVKPSNVFVASDGQVTVLDRCGSDDHDDLPALGALLLDVLGDGAPPHLKELAALAASPVAAERPSAAQFRAIVSAPPPPIATAQTARVLAPVQLAPLMDEPDVASASTALRPELVARKPRGLRRSHLAAVLGIGALAIALAFAFSPSGPPVRPPEPTPLAKLAAIPVRPEPEPPRATADLLQKHTDFVEASKEAERARTHTVAPLRVKKRLLPSGGEPGVSELMVVVLLDGKEVAANVTVGDRWVGPAPVYFPTEGGRSKTITVEWRPFPISVFQVDVPSGKTLRVDVELRPL